MNSYFSTFITGFESVVERALPKTLKEVKIEQLSDGLVIYKTTSHLEEIKGVKFFNNSFILLKLFHPLPDNPIKTMLLEMLHNHELELLLRKLVLKNGTKFRVRALVENQFVAIDNNLLAKVEAKISTLTKLVINRSLPDIEFHILTRSEGFGLIGVRLTRRSNYEKTLERGELYPELAYLLCLISEPNKNDIFLDPFSGSGSISIQRAVSFPYRQVLAGEIDSHLVNKLRRRTSNLPQKIIVSQGNALDLQTFSNNSVDKIVTDPPWGLHTGKSLTLPKFYFQMMQELHRIVKPDGVIVILTAQKELFEETLNQHKNKLELIKKYNTLVSGKKASVYKIKKI